MPRRAKKTGWEQLQRKHVACYGGCLILVLLLVAMYSRYALDFPYADQWDFVPFLEKAYEGGLTWRDFWAQHNEHRLVFPRLVMWGLAMASQWNVYWELATNFLLALVTWLFCCSVVRHGGREVSGGDHAVVYLCFALLFFSLSQWGNWFLGWQVQVFLNVLASIGVMAALAWRVQTRMGIAVAIAAGVISTYSFANGMLVWPIGALLLWLRYRTEKKMERALLQCWLVASAVVIASYLAGYERPEHHGSLTAVFGQPVQYALYVLAYLGQPLGRAEDLVRIALEFSGRGGGTPSYALCVVMGALGILVWSVTLVQLRLSGVPLRVLLPWLGIALYALGTAAITGIGRVEEGLAQAVSSRYVTVANLLWLSIVVQTFWVGRNVEREIVQRLMPVKLGVLCVLVLGASLAGAYRWTERYHAYAALRGAVISGYDAEALRSIYPPAPEMVLERRRTMQYYRLSVFGEQNEGADLSAGPPS